MRAYRLGLLFAALVSASATAAPVASGWNMQPGPGPRAPDTAAGTALKSTATDPTGDTATGLPYTHDITRLTADVVGSNLVLTVSLANTISPPNSGRADALVGYIDIDVDGSSTETASNLANNCPSAGLQGPTIGTDFFVFLFSGSTTSTEIVAFGANTITGAAATSYGSSSVSLTVPLSAIGNASQGLRVAMVLGPPDGPSDCAPNQTTLAATSATVGPAVQVTGSAQAGSTMTFRSPVTGVRYDWDFDGDGIFERGGAANALNVTYPGAFNGTVSVLTTDANGNRTISTQALSAAAPRLTVGLTGANASQICGDNDSFAEPGESFRVPVRITNSGNAATRTEAAVSFAPSDRLAAAAQGQSTDGRLLVQTPLVDVGIVQPAAFVDRNVDVTIATTATCGTNVGFQFTGGFDNVSSSAGSTSTIQFGIPSACNTFTGSCPLANQLKVDVTPRQGLYFNANRAGNGLSNFVIPVQGGSSVYFGAWFTGAADRTPTWYVIQGNLNGNSVVAPIFRFTRNLASQTFAVNSTVVGQAVVVFKTPEQMAFLWTIGNKSGLETMSYLTPGPAAAPNRTGAWYNLNEGGWGKVIHAFSQNGANTIFAVDYIYDAAGEPRWVLTQETEAALATSGAPHTTYQVHCPGCPWIADWASFALSAGNGSEVFTDSRNGRTTTSFALPNPLAGSWNRTNLPITILTVPQ